MHVLGGIPISGVVSMLYLWVPYLLAYVASLKNLRTFPNCVPKPSENNDLRQREGLLTFSRPSWTYF